jgi:hypothetical protein
MRTVARRIERLQSDVPGQAIPRRKQQERSLDVWRGIVRRFIRRREEINDYWRDVIWPYWVIGIALVAIVVAVV